jgi:uncharacterized RDD family membrane protein YckC
MERNPYAPPTADVTPPAERLQEFEPASRRRRLLNMLIDTAGYYAVAILLGVLLGSFGHEAILNQLADGPASLAFGLVILFLYYVPFEALTGRTLGKLITGTCVVTDSGQPPRVEQILGRTLCRLIPLEAFTFFSSSRVGLHDRLSNTRVVRVRR